MGLRVSLGWGGGEVRFGWLSFSSVWVERKPEVGVFGGWCSVGVVFTPKADRFTGGRRGLMGLGSERADLNLGLGLGLERVVFDGEGG